MDHLIVAALVPMVVFLFLSIQNVFIEMNVNPLGPLTRPVEEWMVKCIYGDPLSRFTRRFTRLRRTLQSTGWDADTTDAGAHEDDARRSTVSASRRTRLSYVARGSQGKPSEGKLGERTQRRSSLLRTKRQAETGRRRSHLEVDDDEVDDDDRWVACQLPSSPITSHHLLSSPLIRCLDRRRAARAATQGKRR